MTTYRLQLSKHFKFQDACNIVGYLSELGIDICYISPVLTARKESNHGYDIIDYSKLNPELGTENEFLSFSTLLKKYGMGLMLDVVPNHMCIAGTLNKWWHDVLENGPASRYAKYFDIDWDPPKQDLKNKVLLPVLGDQYGKVLENGELKISYNRGLFSIQYYDLKFPIAPKTYTNLLLALLERITNRFDENNRFKLELESIITAIEYLPSRTESDNQKLKERHREKEIIKRRIRRLIWTHSQIESTFEEVINEFNGVIGNPNSFDKLEQLLADQPYRLSYWRTAADEINYRRFFDINELAAIRVEDSDVFRSVHDLVFRLIKDGIVTALRIDHVDGLYDPAKYFQDIRNCISSLTTTTSSISSHSCYIVAEKILGRNEKIRSNWQVNGTTGYDFLNDLNEVFVDQENQSIFHRLYSRLINKTKNFQDISYQSKRLILETAMSGELHVLSRKLDRISEQHRYSRDYPLNRLQYALSEVIACFPVYRSYIQAEQICDVDIHYINMAVINACRRNPAIEASIFHFIGSLLQSHNPKDLSEAQLEERRDFIMRFQQLTAPVTAKGVEDTAFYRYFPLASLCEVGGDPSRFGMTIEEFHLRNMNRVTESSVSMLTTSTHDTKRDEDVRARLNALSEIPTAWYRAVRRWMKLNRDFKTIIDDLPAPDEREEYLLYQTLIGTWPFDIDQSSSDGLNRELDSSFNARILNYMIKAIREAKVNSSWANPNKKYESAFHSFIDGVLDSAFVDDFSKFHRLIATAGMFNSLSQSLIKITSPGVPDFYQGSEQWRFNLVDPDNRQPVDFNILKQNLSDLRSREAQDPIATISNLVANPNDGKIKMLVTRKALLLRKKFVPLFLNGEYIPIEICGEFKRNILAFARILNNKSIITIAGRFFTGLINQDRRPLGRDVWNDTTIILPDRLQGLYKDIYTNKVFSSKSILVGDLFQHLPLALLEINNE